MGSATSYCSSDQLHYLTEHSHFEEAEIAHMYHRYLIENTNGKLSRKKYNKLMKALGFENKAFIDTLFAGITEHRKTKFITFPDLINALSIVERGSSIEKIRFAFQLWAPNHSRVSRLEIIAFMDKIQNVISIRDPRNQYLMIVSSITESLQTKTERRIVIEEFLKALFKSTRFRELITEAP